MRLASVKQPSKQKDFENGLHGANVAVLENKVSALSCADELSRFPAKHFIRQTRLSRCQCRERPLTGQPRATE